MWIGSLIVLVDVLARLAGLVLLVGLFVGWHQHLWWWRVMGVGGLLHLAALVWIDWDWHELAIAIGVLLYASHGLWNYDDRLDKT